MSDWTRYLNERKARREVEAENSRLREEAKFEYARAQEVDRENDRLREELANTHGGDGTVHHVSAESQAALYAERDRLREEANANQFYRELVRLRENQKTNLRVIREQEDELSKARIAIDELSYEIAGLREYAKVQALSKIKAWENLAKLREERNTVMAAQAPLLAENARLREEANANHYYRELVSLREENAQLAKMFHMLGGKLNAEKMNEGEFHTGSDEDFRGQGV